MYYRLVRFRPNVAIGLIERDYAINRAMKELYRDGCRRFRYVRLPPSGDYDRIRVIGWPA